MAEIKVLEKIGVENENVDGAAFNNFLSSGRNGVMKGVLEECRPVITANNSFVISTGELLIQGFRVKITQNFEYSFDSFPAAESNYWVIGRMVLYQNRSVSFYIGIVPEFKTLTQNNLYKTESGTYECVIAKFKHTPSGIKDLSLVLEVITGRQTILGETAETAYAGDKGKRNADNIVGLQNQINLTNKNVKDNETNIELLTQFILVSGQIVVSEITEAYENRVTANGATILDGAKSTLKKVEGNTVACHNLINFDGIQEAGVELTGCEIDYTAKTIKFNGGTNSRLIFRGNGIVAYNKFIKFFNIKGAGIYRFSFKRALSTPNTEVYVNRGGVRLFTLYNRGANKLTFEITDDHIKELQEGYDNISFYVRSYETDTFSDIQIVEGEEEKPYQPYFTGVKHASFKGIKSTGKNLIPYPYSDTTKTTKGITFTDNGDGSITINGTNDGSGNSVFFLATNTVLPAGTYIGSMGTTEPMNLMLYDGTNYYDTRNTTHTIDSQKRITSMYIQVIKGNTTVYNNVKVYPMFNFGKTSLPYEPYKEDTLELPTAVECGLGTMIDFENRRTIHRGIEITLTGNENEEYFGFKNYAREYPQHVTGKALYAVYIEYSVLTKESRPKGVSTDGIVVSREDTPSLWKTGALWVGVDNTTLYWVNANDYLGLSYNSSNLANPLEPTEEEGKQMHAAFREYLRQRYAAGNPVKIRYAASSIQSEELISIGDKLVSHKDGMETVLGNSNRDYVKNTITQEYFEYAGGTEE